MWRVRGRRGDRWGDVGTEGETWGQRGDVES